jgi:hypothetical protein
MSNISAEVEASALVGTKIEAIAKEIIEKDKLTEEELLFVYKLAAGIVPSKMVVSASETRQVRQYEPNAYHASIELSLAGVNDTIIERVMNASPKDRPAILSECKRIVYGMISQQYKVNENFLRRLIETQQNEDGIKR